MTDTNPSLCSTRSLGAPSPAFGIPPGSTGVARRPVLLALFEASYPTSCLQQASALAQSLEVALHVVRVLPQTKGVLARWSRRDSTAVLQEVGRTLTAHRATRAWIREALSSPGAVQRFGILHGAFAGQVAVYAGEVEAQLVVVAPGEDSLGSTVTSLACAAGVPVAVLRSPRGSRTIVAATDLQNASYPVLHAAAKLARQLNRSVVALHSLNPMSTVEAAEPNWPTAAQRGEAVLAAWLERLTTVSRELPAVAHAVVREESDPVDAILAEARQRDADFVVVGARPGGWLERSRLKSVASGVVNGAQRSVVVTPISRMADKAPPLAWG